MLPLIASPADVERRRHDDVPAISTHIHAGSEHVDGGLDLPSWMGKQEVPSTAAGYLRDGLGELAVLCFVVLEYRVAALSRIVVDGEASGIGTRGNGYVGERTGGPPSRDYPAVR